MPHIMYRKESNLKISSDYVPKVKVMDNAGKQLSIPVLNGDCGNWDCSSKVSHGLVFQSYGANVAYIRKTTSRKITTRTVHLYKPYWNMYSQTTNKYLLQFLDEASIADIRKKVESGEYIEMS